MVGVLREERPAQIYELLHSSCFSSFLPLRETEILNRLRAGECAGGVHDEDYFFAAIRQFLDSDADGVDVVGEGLGVRRTGACAGEWDYLGRVVVLGVEDVYDFGEGGWALPEAGDEDEGRLGHSA